MDECEALEKLWGYGSRGFESHSLRHCLWKVHDNRACITVLEQSVPKWLV